MRLFRLVNEKENPTDVGRRIVNCSLGRRAKLGDGMYFASSKECALSFNSECLSLSNHNESVAESET